MGEYWEMFKNPARLNKLTSFFFALLVLVTTTVCIAQENVISSVMISKSRSNPGVYELNIDSSQVVSYKAHHEEDGSIYFDLKNSVLAQDAGTIYNDVSDVDNITVRQLDKNKVRIYIKGAHATNTELVFVNSLFDTTQQPKKKVIINKPINHYQAVNHTVDLEENEVIQDWDDNSFNLAHLSSTLMTDLKEGPFGIGLIIFVALTIMGFVTKVLTSKLKQDNEPLIYINNKPQVNQAKMVNIQKEIDEYNASMQVDLKSVRDRSETLKMAQVELAKAHEKYQEYLRNKQKNTQKSKTSSVNNVQRGIALNEYQKSTKNPYLDQEVIKIKKEVLGQPKNNYQIPPRPKTQRQDFTTPYIQRPIESINYKQVTPAKKNNMNFLESVSKIYEQSGRGDLAVELKQSISKAKQSI